MRQDHLFTTNTWDDTLHDVDDTFRTRDVTTWTVDPACPGPTRGALTRAERRASISFVTADGASVVAATAMIWKDGAQ